MSEWDARIEALIERLDLLNETIEAGFDAVVEAIVDAGYRAGGLEPPPRHRYQPVTDPSGGPLTDIVEAEATRNAITVTASDGRSQTVHFEFEDSGALRGAMSWLARHGITEAMLRTEHLSMDGIAERLVGWKG